MHRLFEMLGGLNQEDRDKVWECVSDLRTCIREAGAGINGPIALAIFSEMVREVSTKVAGEGNGQGVVGVMLQDHFVSLKDLAEALKISGVTT